MIRVVVVDDSAFMRRHISAALEMNRAIKVVGEARDPYEARSVISQEKPDVITLDIEMPRMDGLTFLRKLVKHHPVPVVVCSSLAQEGTSVAMEALRAGAIDVIAKPLSGVDNMEFKIDLAQAVCGAAVAKVSALPRDRPSSISIVGVGGKVICIGASTGGAVVVEEILQAMPANCPPIVIAQHLPADFNRAYARKLNQSCAMKVREAQDGDTLEAGLVLLAPGEKHLVVVAKNSRGIVRLKQGPRVHQHRPAVDVLFRSAAQSLQGNAVGVILTGMGSDGARGLLEMRQAGASTLAQSLGSCAVDGMPRAALAAGGVQREVALAKLPNAILSAAGCRTALDAA